MPRKNAATPHKSAPATPARKNPEPTPRALTPVQEFICDELAGRIKEPTKMPTKPTLPESAQSRAADADQLFQRGKEILAQTAPEPPPALPVADRQRSEYVLLNRAMDRADKEERAFLYDFLNDCATAPMTVQEIALACASHHFKLGICAEDLKDSQAKVIRSLRIMEYTNPWLYGFIRSLANAALTDKKKMRPDGVADYFDIAAITDYETELRTTRETLLEYPEALASEIRQAAEALNAK